MKKAVDTQAFGPCIRPGRFSLSKVSQIQKNEKLLRKISFILSGGNAKILKVGNLGWEVGK